MFGGGLSFATFVGCLGFCFSSEIHILGVKDEANRTVVVLRHDSRSDAICFKSALSTYRGTRGCLL